jgi:hypothetical protein
MDFISASCVSALSANRAVHIMRKHSSTDLCNASFGTALGSLRGAEYDGNPFRPLQKREKFELDLNCNYSVIHHIEYNCYISSYTNTYAPRHANFTIAS